MCVKRNIALGFEQNGGRMFSREIMVWIKRMIEFFAEAYKDRYIKGVDWTVGLYPKNWDIEGVNDVFLMKVATFMINSVPCYRDMRYEKARVAVITLEMERNIFCDIFCDSKHKGQKKVLYKHDLLEKRKVSFVTDWVQKEMLNRTSKQARQQKYEVYDFANPGDIRSSERTHPSKRVNFWVYHGANADPIKFIHEHCMFEEDGVKYVWTIQKNRYVNLVKMHLDCVGSAKQVNAHKKPGEELNVACFSFSEVEKRHREAIQQYNRSLPPSVASVVPLSFVDKDME